MMEMILGALLVGLGLALLTWFNTSHIRMRNELRDAKSALKTAEDSVPHDYGMLRDENRLLHAEVEKFKIRCDTLARERDEAEKDLENKTSESDTLRDLLNDKIAKTASEAETRRLAMIDDFAVGDEFAFLGVQYTVLSKKNIRMDLTGDYGPCASVTAAYMRGPERRTYTFTGSELEAAHATKMHQDARKELLQRVIRAQHLAELARLENEVKKLKRSTTGDPAPQRKRGRPRKEA